MVYGGGGAAAAAAAIAQAIKASGAIVSVGPEDFMQIVDKADKPLVVASENHFVVTRYKYLTGYKGLVFFTSSPAPLMFKSGAELVSAKKIWIPG